MDIDKLFEEAIKLELNVRDIYSYFARKFPEDYSFWWELVLEEGNHASLLRSGKDFFNPQNKFPEKLLFKNLAIIEEQNEKLQRLLKSFEKKDLLRAEAFQIAYNIEKSAGELHFQNFMEDKSGGIDEVFRKLNKDDKAHAERIKFQMGQLGIPALKTDLF